MRRLVLAFLGLSLVVVVWLGKDLWVEARTYGWTEVPAVVSHSEASVVATLKRSSGSLAQAQRHWYQLDLTYDYAVAGVPHQSHLVGLLDTPVLNKGAADALVAQYPAGATVTAYVSPDDPDLAVLHPGLTPLTVILFLAALAATLAAGRMALVPDPARVRSRPSVS